VSITTTARATSTPTGRSDVRTRSEDDVSNLYESQVRDWRVGGFNTVTVSGVEGEALVCSVAVSDMRVSLDSDLLLATAVEVSQKGNGSV